MRGQTMFLEHHQRFHDDQRGVSAFETAQELVYEWQQPPTRTAGVSIVSNNRMQMIVSSKFTHYTQRSVVDCFVLRHVLNVCFRFCSSHAQDYAQGQS